MVWKITLGLFAAVILLSYFAKDDYIAQSNSSEAEAARQEEMKAVPDMIPPLLSKPIEQSAITKSLSVKTDRFCKELGQALRSKKDPEYTRAMIKRAADEFGTELKFRDESLIKEKSFQLGFTQCAVSAAIGYPERVNRSVYKSGVHEQWVYADGNVYIYFEDGILTSWQE